MCGPSPIFHLWCLEGVGEEFEQLLMLPNHPMSSHKDGAVNGAKLASSLPSATTDLMSLKTAALPPQSQQCLIRPELTSLVCYDKSRGLSATNLVPLLSARELPTLSLMKRIEMDVPY